MHHNVPTDDILVVHGSQRATSTVMYPQPPMCVLYGVVPFTTVCTKTQMDLQPNSIKVGTLSELYVKNK